MPQEEVQMKIKSVSMCVYEKNLKAIDKMFQLHLVSSHLLSSRARCQASISDHEVKITPEYYCKN